MCVQSYKNVFETFFFHDLEADAEKLLGLVRTHSWGNLIMRELLTRIWNDCPISQMSHVLREQASLTTYSLKLFDKDGGVICSGRGDGEH